MCLVESYTPTHNSNDKANRDFPHDFLPDNFLCMVEINFFLLYGALVDNLSTLIAVYTVQGLLIFVMVIMLLCKLFNYTRTT